MHVLRTKSTIALIVVFVVCSASICFAGKKSPQNSSKAQTKVVDSGSFGIYVQQKRVATETFRIEQSNSFSVVQSEFKTDAGEKVAQSAELRVAPNGDFRHYSWSEKNPGKGQLVVDISGEFLVESITPDEPEKPQTITLLLTPATAVLDDYMFSHREILIWRYMAQSCGSTITSDCTMPRTQFGALVPRQHTSAVITAEYKGKEKATIRGVEKTLDCFSLVFEGDEWTCFLDENMKLVKIVIPSESTEVIRD